MEDHRPQMKEDLYGSFTIVCSKGGEVVESRRFGYTEIGSLTVDGVQYFAVTKAFEGIFPIQCVFTLDVVSRVYAKKLS